MVIALALEPYVQAAVGHYNCDRPSTSNEAYPGALVPRSNIYDPETATICAGDVVLDVDAQIAIYKSLIRIKG